MKLIKAPVLIKTAADQPQETGLPAVISSLYRYSGGLPLTALAIMAMTKRMIKIKNKICAISTAAPAMPVKPSTPAIKATTRKVIAQPNMVFSLQARDLC